jgi:predicted nucleic-acid-binding protein
VKGLDSSILLRYALEDDPVWTEPATRFIDEQCTIEDPGFINSVVLAEVVWSMRRAPGFSKDHIASFVTELLDSDNLVVENEDEVEAALKAFKGGSAGFVDCLIAVLNRRAEAAPTYSIDKDAIRAKVFAAIPRKKPQ